MKTQPWKPFQIFPSEMGRGRWEGSMRSFAFVMFAGIALMLWPSCRVRTPSNTTSNESATAAASDVFSVVTPLSLRIDAPLRQLFVLARAGTPNSGMPGQADRVTEYIEDTVAVHWQENGRPESVLGAKIKVRGNNSVEDCQFPKLAVKFKKQSLGGSLFAPYQKLKIGTHCGDKQFGRRLKNEKATWRQVALLELASIFDVPTLQARRVKIAYHDTTADLPAALFANGTKRPDSLPDLTRAAFLLEDTGDRGERLGYQEATEDDLFKRQEELNSAFDVKTAMKIALFNAMIGNTDWNINVNPKKDPYLPRFYNVDFLMKERAGKITELLPIVHDFDLGSALTDSYVGIKAEVPPEFTQGEVTDAMRSVYSVLEFIRSRKFFSPEQNHTYLPQLRAEFLSRRAAAEGRMASAQYLEGDSDGFPILKRHMDAFFQLLEHLDQIFI
jgi:hypothetical protein